MIGGSTIFSAGVPDSQTVSAYLQEYFDKDELDFDVEVINAGVGGSYSEVESRLIQERLIFYNPDLFLIYDGWNDLEHIRAPNFYSIPTKKIISTFENQNVTGKSSPEIWKNRWNDICNLGNENEFETIITLQPIAGTGKRILTDQEFEYYNIHRSQDLLKPYPLFAEELSNLKKSCSDAVDLRGIFDDISEAVYYDEGHVGSLGNSIVAQHFHDLALPIAIKNMENRNQNNVKINESYKDIKSDIKNKIIAVDYNNLEFRINQVSSYYDSPEKIFDLILLYYKTPSAISSIVDKIEENNFERFNQQKENEKYFNENDYQTNIIKNENFTETIFNKSNLQKVTFENVDLTKAKFIESDLTLGKISDSDLTTISIIRSNLNNVTIVNSNLDGSVIAYVNLSNADLSNVNFKNSRFLSTEFDNNVIENSDFSYSDLSNHDLSNVNFKNINFQNAYLVNTNLSNADLSNQEITGISLISTNLTNANLSNNDLSGIDMSNAILVGVNFTNSNLKNVIFTNAILESEYNNCINHILCK